MNNLFYSLEDGKYYTYPDGDEATGIQIREVIEANERSISKLQQETEKLKKQYCERTDCGGRIGNSKKVEELQKENEQLKEQLLVTQTNEETFRLEMEDITKTLGLDENTIFDDVKVYARSLKDNWNELKEWVNKHYDYYMNNEDYIGGRLCFTDIKNKMQELEQGSDSNAKD